MRWLPRVPLRIVCVSGLAAILAACAHESTEPAATPDGFTQLVERYLEAPEADAYSAEQRATLERARAAGELTFEEYSAAVDSSLACISDAGFFVDRGEIDTSRGFPELAYFYEGPEEGNPVADACIRLHSEAIEAIYQLQPSSVEAAQVRLSAQAADLEVCLRRAGVEVDFADLEGDELEKAVYDALGDSMKAATTGSEPDLECFAILAE